MTLNDKRYIAAALKRASLPADGPDGRDARRHPFQTLLQVTPIEKAGGRLRPYRTRRCPTINVSQSGLRLLWIGTERPSRVVVELEGTGDNPTRIECSVAWWKELTADRNELGLQFQGRYPCPEEDLDEADEADES